MVHLVLYAKRTEAAQSDTAGKRSDFSPAVRGVHQTDQLITFVWPAKTVLAAQKLLSEFFYRAKNVETEGEGEHNI